MMLQLLRSVTKSFRFKVRVDFFETKDNPHRVGYYMLYDFNQHYQNRNDSRICVSRNAKKDACRQPPVSRAEYIKFNFVGHFKRKYKDKKTLSSV